MPRAFDILRRWYFNQTRAGYQEALGLITDRADLVTMLNCWVAKGYHRQALHLVEKRIAAVSL